MLYLLDRHSCSIVSVFHALVAGSLLALVSPASAQTATPPAENPVAISYCHAHPKGSSIELVFRNRSNRAMDRITFKVEDVYELFFLKASGTFSPGITVNRFFAVSPKHPLNPLKRPKSCSATAVEFVDGSTWSSDQ